VHEDVQTLLALQEDDVAIHAIEAELNALAPRLTDLDRVRQVAAEALDRARGLAAAEEKRSHDLHIRLGEQKQVHERNLHNLDLVKKAKEAAAAMLQVEASRKALAETESDLLATSRRLTESRASVETQQRALAELEASQAAAREEIAGERAALEERLRAARGKREGVAQRVARPLLAKYDRIRGRRRAQAIYALRGPSCGNCDTAIPLQRRNVMTATGQIEICEACGVLLYASE
jgi:predicted  nucleic acid-binding Zn-ribbon protein